MRRGNSGQIRVLEAFLATAVVFSALLLAGPIYIVLENNGDQEVLYSIGVNVLMELDRDGELGQLIAQSNWTVLSERLSCLLPLGVSYNLTVYNENMQVVNNALVSGGSLVANKVVSVQYILAERTNFQFYVIRLQLAWMK